MLGSSRGHSANEVDRRRAAMGYIALGVFTRPKHAHKPNESAHSFSMPKGSVDIDDELLREAQRLSGIQTKRAVAHASLKLWVRHMK